MKHTFGTSVEGISWVHNRIAVLVFLLTFVLVTYLRFSDLETRMQFNWDQAENAWVMKNMIFDGKMPLQGMVAKGNSGFFIGPGYYYLLAPVYRIYDLDPIAAGVFAGLVSIFTWIIFVSIVRKLFGLETSVIAGILYGLSNYVVKFDRIPWPVIFIPVISILIYYFLIEFLKGNDRPILAVALITGFAFHFHFTAVYFPIIILFSLPLTRWTRKRFLLLISSLPLFLIWFVPSFIASLQSHGSDVSHLGTYLTLYYHGIHLRRILQVGPDILIDLKGIMTIDVIKPLAITIIPLFLFFLVKTKEKNGKGIIIWVSVLWFLVPLVIMSAYKGEISDYYYSLLRPLAAMILGFILYKFFSLGKISKLLVIGFLGVFASMNLLQFQQNGKVFSLPEMRGRANQALKSGTHVDFVEGSGFSYLYFYYRYKQSGVWPN